MWGSGQPLVGHRALRGAALLCPQPHRGGCVSMCPPGTSGAGEDAECRRMEVRKGEGNASSPFLLLSFSRSSRPSRDVAQGSPTPQTSVTPSPSSSPSRGSAGSFQPKLSSSSPFPPSHPVPSSLPSPHLPVSRRCFWTRTQTRALRSHYLRPHPATRSHAGSGGPSPAVLSFPLSPLSDLPGSI